LHHVISKKNPGKPGLRLACFLTAMLKPLSGITKKEEKETMIASVFFSFHNMANVHDFYLIRKFTDR
jgi:hypothetical protein